MAPNKYKGMGRIPCNSDSAVRDEPPPCPPFLSFPPSVNAHVRALPSYNHPGVKRVSNDTYLFFAPVEDANIERMDFDGNINMEGAPFLISLFHLNPATYRKAEVDPNSIDNNPVLKGAVSVFIKKAATDQATLIDADFAAKHQLQGYQVGPHCGPKAKPSYQRPHQSQFNRRNTERRLNGRSAGPSRHRHTAPVAVAPHRPLVLSAKPRRDAPSKTTSRVVMTLTSGTTTTTMITGWDPINKFAWPRSTCSASFGNLPSTNLPLPFSFRSFLLLTFYECQEGKCNKSYPYSAFPVLCRWNIL
ncbi:hypothetical protein NMY22_g11107 [Coprinellus aureogranulatus]|nr:hypothetical protein NMY22_g11107 [Coprinellus aureogranulatus]